MTIHQKFTGDPSQLLKAYQDLAAANARLDQNVAKLAGSYGAAASFGVKGQGAFNNIVRQGASEVQNLAAQWGGVAMVLASVKGAYDEVIDRQLRAANTNVTVGSSQADIIRNLTGVSSATKKAFIEQAQAAFAETKFGDLNEFNRAAASGLSASSGDREGTLNALKASAQLTRDKPQDLALLVGAALDIQKASGNKSAEENLGFLLQTGGQARQVDLRAQAMNIPSALISASNTVKGDRAQATREGAALFAALGSQGGDVRGESTRTAVQSFTVQLRDFFEKGIEKNVRGHKFFVKPGDDPGTIEGRISALQKDEKLRNQFLEKASFERQFQVPVEQLLKGGATDKQFRSSLQQIHFGREEFDQQVRELKGLTAATSLSTADSASKGGLQLAELINAREARISKAREIRDLALREARQYASASPGLRFIGDQGENLHDFMKAQLDGRDPLQDAVNRVARRRQDILQPPSLLGARDNWAPERSRSELNADERRTLDFVDGQLALLRELLEEDKAAARAMEEQTGVLRKIEEKLQPKPAGADAARALRGVGREQ